MARKKTTKMWWTDVRGKKQERAINHTLDIRDFKDTMGYPWLLMAANPHLSASDIQSYLELMGPDLERGVSWIKRRRKMFQPFDEAFPASPMDRDGKDERAFAIMRQHRTASIRHLVRLLEEYGIIRGREWVRLNRTR